jgi:hypothetical protein
MARRNGIWCQARKPRTPRAVPMPAGPYQLKRGCQKRSELHDLGAALRGVAGHVGEHVQHEGHSLRAPCAVLGEPVLRHRREGADAGAEFGGHGPGARLHHQFGDVPEGLHLDDAVPSTRKNSWKRKAARWPVGGMSRKARAKVPA